MTITECIIAGESNPQDAGPPLATWDSAVRAPPNDAYALIERCGLP